MTEVAFKMRPVSGPITQGFGDIYTGYPHRGVDFGVNIGTPIYAPADGYATGFTNSTVTWHGERVKSYGFAVCIDHGADKVYRYSLYAHMSKVVAQIGDTIKAGDLIGYSGNTGVSTGPHLHWQLCKYNTFPVTLADSADPLLFMEADLTRDETLALIAELQNSGALASTTDVLACIAQIAGSEELTYTDKDRIEAVRLALGNLPGTPPAKTPATTTKGKTE